MPDLVEGEEVQEETPAEETHDGFVSDKQHAERIGVQHKKFRDEERGRVAAEGRLSNVETELEALKTKQAEVIVPPVPDPLSETYATDVQTRDDAIKAQVGNEAEAQRKADELKEKDEARLVSEKTAEDKMIAGFDANMIKHGLDPAAAIKAGNTVADYGISKNFEDVLLEDPDGPLFVMYLANNPIELENMNGMSMLQLVNHLNGDIRAKASLLKPQTSTAPDPPTTPSGGGAPELQENWERGAKYE